MAGRFFLVVIAGEDDIQVDADSPHDWGWMLIEAVVKLRARLPPDTHPDGATAALARRDSWKE